MNENIQNLIPKHKFDIEIAEKLTDCAVEDIKPIIPSLLEWLQDMNWPIARPISKYLISINDQITNEILEVFKTKDEVWKYWIISNFGPITTSIEVRNEIERIAYHPTKNEQTEELDELSLEILKVRNWNRL
jgi:hypothetical protein